MNKIIKEIKVLEDHKEQLTYEMSMVVQKLYSLKKQIKADFKSSLKTN